ncbi:MAG TPA: pyridoxamine 5'-phosphate oxidase family protein [Pseudonocardiaceae bacterium]|jgi:drug/metabolite transporter (DMT)-like permease/nitroimidazol reductase NimA-like FMN-containing flavoprotein (pyridoxamine 5'-phosphate oxidase superfamily)|nr:pyridoxamine 5'-phosphate oxidase family protein [Pseudonocardiaceae bacterium]
MRAQSIDTLSTRKALPSLGWAALGVLAFSFTFPATALAEQDFNPYFVGAGRSVIAATVAAACLRWVRAPLPQREHWAGLITVAVGCGIGFGLLSALALQHTTSSHAAVVIGLLPAATAAVAAIRIGERPGPLFWAASCLGTAAVVGYMLSRQAGTLRAADLLLLAALLAGAAGYAEGGRLARTMPGWQVIAWGVLAALPISLPITVVAIAYRPMVQLSASAVAGLAYVGIVSMFVGFLAWYRGLAGAGVARASQIQLCQPLLTIAWSVPLLGDHLDAAALLTLLVVSVCVLVTQRARDAGTRPERAADVAATPLGATPRTRIRRHADRAIHNRDELYEILDAGLVAHVAFVADGYPVVLPMGYARDGDTLLLHGSSRNRMLRNLAGGAELCATITLLDGLVLGATAFTHSMNYRSAVIYGRATPITDPRAKGHALDRVVDFLLPGRTRDLPEHRPQELTATLVLAVPLSEVSVKARSGPPPPASSPGRRPWTGVIPLALTRGEPQPSTAAGSEQCPGQRPAR